MSRHEDTYWQLDCSSSTSLKAGSESWGGWRACVSGERGALAGKRETGEGDTMDKNFAE